MAGPFQEELTLPLEPREGPPSVVADEVFGNALEFDGTSAITTALKQGIGARFTLSVWVLPANPADDTPRGIVEIGDRVRLWSEGPTLRYTLTTEDGETVEGSARNFFPSAEWTHVVLVKAGRRLRLYGGGEPVGDERTLSSSLGLAAEAPLNLGRVDLPNGAALWNGRMVQVSLYGRQLSDAEIADLFMGDQAGVSAFHSTYPVDFSLLNDNDLPILEIDRIGVGRNLLLEFVNRSGKAIVLGASTDKTPSEANAHFELRFRPGTLLTERLSALTLSEDDARGWALRAVSGAVSGNPYDALFLLCTAAEGNPLLHWSPQEPIAIHLRGVFADGRQGAHGTRVEGLFRGMTYADSSVPLRGSRVRHLEVASPLGIETAPLEIGFVGTSMVLNDGRASNRLHLRLRNASDRETIRLKPQIGGATDESSTKLLIDFAERPEDAPHLLDWMLGDASEIAAIQVAAEQTAMPGHQAPLWVADESKLGAEAHFALSPAYDEAASYLLHPGMEIIVALDGIRTSAPTGLTSVTVTYKNIDGYPDGRLTTAIQKAPLLFSEAYFGKQRKTFASIGMDPPEKVDVSYADYNLLNAGDYYGRGHVWLFAYEGEGSSGTAYLQARDRSSDSRVALRLRTKNADKLTEAMHLSSEGNVGIGTTSPKSTLHVEGRYYGKGDLTLYAFEGEGNSGTAYIQARDDRQRSDTALQFRVQNGKDVLDALRITPKGDVGVGTAAPEARLHVISRNGDPNGGVLVVGPTNQANLRLGYEKDYAWIQSHGGSPLKINPLGNDVIIGIDPQRGYSRLRSQADLYARGHVWLYAYEGEGQSGTTYIQARDDSGKSDLSMQFRVQSNGGNFDILRLDSKRRIQFFGIWFDEEDFRQLAGILTLHNPARPFRFVNR